MSEKVIPLISIIIPIYNVEKYICRCVESVVNQTYPNLEIILINDGSTDSSGDIIYSYKNRDNIVIIDKENSGQSDCRNIGYKISHGEYLYFMDSDDILEPDAIEILYSTIVKYNSDFCCCRYRLVNEQDEVLKESMLYHQEVLSDNIRIMHEAFTANEIKSTLWIKLLRRKFLEENNLEPVQAITLHDDCMLTFLCAVYATKVCFTNDILYNALQRDNSISRLCKSKMVTVYEDIYRILQDSLKFTGKFNLVTKDFYIGYGKSVLYALILASVRIDNYKGYKKIYGSIGKESFYYLREFKQNLWRGSKMIYSLYILSKFSYIYYWTFKMFGRIFHH